MATTTTPLLTALLKKSTLDDHDELLKASNAALKKSNTDLQAQYVKTIALLKLDKYEDAVKFIEDCGAKLKDRAPFEYAYALYKVGQFDKSAETASTLQTRAAKHIEAQARYRLEDTQRTLELYKELRSHQDPSEDFDLRVNQGAIDAQSQWLGLADPHSIKRPGREDLEAFETAYNAACGSIARGELSQAEILLKRAKELCKHSEDLTEEQKVEELLPISVQQLYVFQSLGKENEADGIVEEIQSEKISDHATGKIAASNILLNSKAVANPFITHKSFNATPDIPRSDRLFSFQSLPLLSNSKIVDLQAFKLEGIESSTSKELSKKSLPSVSPEVLLLSVFNAAAHSRNEVGKAAIQKVLPALQSRPNDIGLIITLVQMYVLTGNTHSAIELVESLFERLNSSMVESEKDIRFNPGLISILIGLYRSQGRKSHIKQELARAANYWRHKSNAPTSLLRAAGSSLLESSNPEDLTAAAEIFSKLREQQPNDRASIAGYIASHATEVTESDASKLTSIDDLTRNIDVDSLENSGIPQPSNALVVAQLGRSRKRAAPNGTSTKPKRVRKSRLPKDYDPSKTPDPDRWLPLRDRSSYRPPKSKKKGRRGDDRTQGGAVNEDLNIESKSASAPPPTNGGGGKKKKGKGKK